MNKFFWGGRKKVKNNAVNVVTPEMRATKQRQIRFSKNRRKISKSDQSKVMTQIPHSEVIEKGTSYVDFTIMLLKRHISFSKKGTQQVDNSLSIDLKKQKEELQTVYDKVMNVDSEDVLSRVDALMSENGVVDQNEVKRLINARKADIEQSEMDNLRKVFNGPYNHDKLTEKFGIDITRAKIACLKPGTWLNDEVINFYMSMLQERNITRCEYNKQRTSHYFSSFFLDRLMANGQYSYSNVKRWTKKFNVFEKDKIFIPVNIKNTHWTMAVVFVQRKELRYYDSMSGSGELYLTAILRWLVDEAREKQQMVLDQKEWRLVWRQNDVPQQRNGVDCGVFSTICADFLSDDLPINSYSQEEMPSYRIKIGAAILRGTLNY